MSIVPLSSVRPIVKTPETDHEIMCGICGVNDERDSDADDENTEAIKVKAGVFTFADGNRRAQFNSFAI